MTSLVNTKTALYVLFEDMINKIESGDIVLKVSNQFDEYILKSALKKLDGFDIEKEAKDINPEYMSTMDWASIISDYEAPEIDDAWFD